MSTLIIARHAEPSAPLSALDRRLVALSRSHAAHADGPVLPCPLCFEPSLAVPSEPTAAGQPSLAKSIAEPTRLVAAA